MSVIYFCSNDSGDSLRFVVFTDCCTDLYPKNEHRGFLFGRFDDSETALLHGDATIGLFFVHSPRPWSWSPTAVS